MQIGSLQRHFAFFNTNTLMEYSVISAKYSQNLLHINFSSSLFIQTGEQMVYKHGVTNQLHLLTYSQCSLEFIAVLHSEKL